jgi:hypothetical protein
MWWARSRRTQPIPAVFHVTHVKAGSQWVYAVLNQLAPDRIVTPRAGSAHVLDGPLRPGAIYPTVYLDRPRFEALALPTPHRRFVIIRDLRDTWVSLYFSLRYSHPLISDNVAEWRRVLGSLDEEEGLLRLLERQLLQAVQVHRTWAGQDELVVRYEELIENQQQAFARIVAHCELDVGRRWLRKIVAGSSFERQSGRPRGQEDCRSHLRKGVAGDWVNHLTPRLKDEFKRRYAEVLVETGYETDDTW